MYALFVAVALSFHAARRPAALIGGKRANSALMAAAEEALEHAAIATADATGVVVPTAIVSAPRTLTPEQEIDELYETLELYDGRLLDLEGRQSFVESEAERAVQKVGAFWIARLAQADAREAEADAKVAAAEARAAEAEARAAKAEERAQAAEEASRGRLADTASDLRAVLDRLGEGSAAGKADAAPERKAKAVVDVVKEKAEEEKPAKEAVEEAAVKDAGAAVAVGAATEAPKTTAEVATETKTAATDEKGGGDKAAAGGE